MNPEKPKTEEQPEQIDIQDVVEERNVRLSKSIKKLSIGMMVAGGVAFFISLFVSHADSSGVFSIVIMGGVMFGVGHFIANRDISTHGWQVVTTTNPVNKPHNALHAMIEPIAGNLGTGLIDLCGNLFPFKSIYYTYQINGRSYSQSLPVYADQTPLLDGEGKGFVVVNPNRPRTKHIIVTTKIPK